MKNIMALLFISILVFGAYSCKKNPVEPDNKPGTRNYTWSVDTIIIPYGYLSRISGSGPDDVWAIGPGGDIRKTIYHYDGSSWKTDGLFRSISPWCVHSISKNSVWLGGQDGRIWRFNGQSWSSNYTYTKNNREVTFLDICGDSDNNIYAIGHADSSDASVPVIINYNGHSWNEIKTQSYETYAFMRIRKDDPSGKYYILGWGEKNNRDIDGLFELKDDKVTQIYEELYIKNKVAVQQIEDSALFAMSDKICTYNGSDFIPFMTINEPNFGRQFYGRNRKDIFLRMEDGIAHYNGNDIQYLYKLPGPMSITDGILFDNDVFFIAREPSIGATYIIRGRKNK